MPVKEAVKGEVDSEKNRRPAVGKRLLLVFLVVGLSALVFLSERLPVVRQPVLDDRYGGTVVIGSFVRPDLLNPIFTHQTMAANLQWLLFNRLATVDEKTALAPELARSWEPAGDRSWIFHLRQDVRFHDGRPCTAEDVAFTYRAILDKRNNSPRFDFLSNIEAVAVLDSYTVEIRFQRFQPTPPFHVLMVPIVPRHLLEGDVHNPAFEKQPIGTGPFRFSGWLAENRLELVANKDYFAGRPYLDRVVFVIKDNRTVLWSDLMVGEIDVMSSLLPEDAKVVEEDSTFVLYRYPSPFYYMLLYNLEKPPFNDRWVRLALSYAIDKEPLIERVLLGHGRLTSGPFYPDSWAYNPAVEPVPYDPQKAKALLDEAGWRDHDGDGVRDKNGRPFRFTLLIDRGDKVKALAGLYIRQQLWEIGVQMEGRFVDPVGLFSDYLIPGRFQAVFMQYNAGFDPRMAAVFWHSSGIGRNNWSRYRNDEVDRLLEEGSLTADQTRRAALYRAVHAQIAYDQPATFLFFRHMADAANARFEGICGGKGINLFSGVRNWYIKAEKSPIIRRL